MAAGRYASCSRRYSGQYPASALLIAAAASSSWLQTPLLQLPWQAPLLQ